MSAVVAAVVGVLVVSGSLFFLVTAVGMLRSRDAISRVNNLSPATGMGLPLIIIGAFVHETAEEGWSTFSLIKALLSVGASLVVSSVASNALGRSAYRTQRTFDPTMRANALGPVEDDGALEGQGEGAAQGEETDARRSRGRRHRAP
jgi:multicomponent Na+:H+ antiporter subunit G